MGERIELVVGSCTESFVFFLHVAENCSGNESKDGSKSDHFHSIEV